MRPQENQDIAIEGLRGVAALLVVLNHLLVATSGIGISSERFGVEGSLRVLVGHFGAFGVQIFFCITGYLFWRKAVASGRITDWASFYRNRILRIAPAYIFSAILVIIFAAYLSNWHVNLIPSELAHDVFAIMSLGLIGQHHFNGIDVTFLNAVIWTLQYEWLFYALLPLAVSMRVRRWTARTALIFMLAYIFAYEPIRYPALFFVSGAIVAELGRNAKPRPFSGSLAFLVAAVVFMTVPYEAISKNLAIASQSDYLGTLSRIAFEWPIISSAFLMAVRFQPRVLTVWPIRRLGTISYSLYLLHLIVMQATLRLVNRMYPASEWTRYQFIVWMLIALAAAIAISSASYFLVERTFLQKKRRDTSKRGAGTQAEMPV